MLAVAGSGGSGIWLYVAGLRTTRADLLTHTVRYDKLQLSVVERGALESAENSDVVCRVKAGTKGSTVATTIKWVIDDGSHVKRGQLLAELDDSGLQEQLKTEKITVDQARAAWVQAEENYKIVDSQNQSDIKTAEIAKDLAAIDLEKYTEGEYKQTLADVDGRIKTAESDLEQYRDRAAWSSRMVKKGYQTASQAQSDQSRLQSGDLALAKVVEERRVLVKFTYPRTVKDLTNKLGEAGRALERTKTQAKAKEVTADSDRLAKKSVYLQEESRYREIEDEIKKCVITSPQDGLVVYYIPEQSRFGSGSQQSIVAQGEPVREGQKLMRIPDLTKMLVNTRVHEALVSRVKGEVLQPTGFCDCVRVCLMTSPDATARLLGANAFSYLREEFHDKEQRVVYPGQPARVRVDAYPDQVLRSHVKSVATVASQQDWLSSDVKVYQTMIAVDESVEGLKPGMSAEVTILIDDSLDHVLTIPIQAIVGGPAMGKFRKCYVLTPEGPQEREIVVGASNEKMAEVKSGLQEGDQVVINPRTLMGERERDLPTGGDHAGFGKGGPEGKAGPGAGGWPGAGANGKGGPGAGGPDGKAGAWPGAGGPKGPAGGKTPAPTS
jgi:HlyD family secretion protein